MMQLFDKLQTETKCEQEWLTSLPLIQSGINGRISQQQYIAFLSQAYHHVKHTVPLMMACGAKLIEHARWVQHFLSSYIVEEVGHEQWILNDIKAAGGDSKLIKNSTPGPACEFLISYAYDIINRVNPYGFFGMVFVLEGTSIQLATKAAKSIKENLKLDDSAFTYLTSHGEVDKEHINFLKDLLNRVESKHDQDFIIHASKHFFKLYGNIFIELENIT